MFFISGRVMEFGHPFELLSIKGTSNQDNENIDDLMKNNEKNQNNGYFLSLVQQTGEPTCSMLIKIAEEVIFSVFINTYVNFLDLHNLT